MNVLVIGSGGREHAICRSLARSSRLDKLFILPGNAGTDSLGTNIPGDPCDIPLALSVARREGIDLTIVGPEDPLAGGIVDAFKQAGLRIFGPTATAARLESDKAFAKQLMRQHAVPTADARVFDDYDLAAQFISSREEGLVIKAAGLCKGKGVVVCADPPEALIAAEKILVGREFGEAGRRIVVEERLEGPEVSLLAIVDVRAGADSAAHSLTTVHDHREPATGRTIYLLESAQDHKRLLDGDRGPNTGGMGAFSPSPRLDDGLLRQIEQQIFVPTLDALVREEIDYCGVLYAGLMLTAAGPKVLEFNCRFGDPETQALLMRMKSDLLEVIDAAVSGGLEDATIEWDPRPSLSVVLASGGYPEKYRTGVPILGLADVEEGESLAVFHAGTARQGEQVVTAGGRVLAVTALGDTMVDAQRRAYDTVERIRFDGMQYRRDLGR
jgi:phosphoribosylamine--glycine ligase